MGTRLQSVVSEVPKPMAPINGTPFLEIQIKYWISQGIINFMQDDKSYLLGEFFRVNDTHDEYRKESFETVFPEYKDLRSYATT